jgi:hypothetical protein
LSPRFGQGATEDSGADGENLKDDAVGLGVFSEKGVRKLERKTTGASLLGGGTGFVP